MMDPIDALATALRLFATHAGRSKQSGKEKCRLLLLMTFGAAAIVAMVVERQQQEQRKLEALEAAVEAVYTDFWNKNKRKRVTNGDGENQLKRRPCKHDHDRAWRCIQQDYLGPEPIIFTDKQFEEVYRLTKTAVERLFNTCCQYRPEYFGRDLKDATGKKGIRVECKVLGILKCVAFGCSGVAFRDYHQMAGNTFTVNLKAFFQAIRSDPELTGTYLRSPTREDAIRVVELHKKKHKVEGLLGSLDCYHWSWKNCPVGQQCHYKNTKNKMSTVVLEAMVDSNAWFWHASFGHPGTNNDINIWDVSGLQAELLSDRFTEEVDFSFEMDGEKFRKLWILVDGIYPPLDRFVKTIPLPVGQTMERFVAWQESARKDVERAFGILARKFQILARPSEYWYVDDLKDQMYGCILMHNMMVEERLSRDECDDAGMYAVVRDGEEDAVAAAVNLERHVQENIGLNPPQESVDAQVKIQIERWKELYDEREHIRLQEAVMNHLVTGYLTYQQDKYNYKSS